MKRTDAVMSDDEAPVLGLVVMYGGPDALASAWSAEE